MPLTITCVRPLCSTTSGVFHEVVLVAVGLPLRLARSGRRGDEDRVRFLVPVEISVSPWTTGVTASPQPRRVFMRPRSRFHCSLPVEIVAVDAEASRTRRRGIWPSVVGEPAA